MYLYLSHSPLPLLLFFKAQTPLINTVLCSPSVITVSSLGAFRSSEHLSFPLIVPFARAGTVLFQRRSVNQYYYAAAAPAALLLTPSK